MHDTDIPVLIASIQPNTCDPEKRIGWSCLKTVNGKGQVLRYSPFLRIDSGRGSEFVTVRLKEIGDVADAVYEAFELSVGHSAPRGEEVTLNDITRPGYTASGQLLRVSYKDGSVILSVRKGSSNPVAPWKETGRVAFGRTEIPALHRALREALPPPHGRGIAVGQDWIEFLRSYNIDPRGIS